jgi:WD40 repeat protein
VQTLIGHVDWVKILLKVPQWLISGGWDENLLFWDNDGDIIIKIDLKLGPISACIADHQKLVMNCKGKGHESELIILDFS